MTKESLQKHLEELGSFDGVGLVRRALPGVAEGLASPMETRLYLRLTLPLRCGGFGLTVDAVNQPIDVAILGKKGSRKSRRSDFIFKRCDDAENKASAICSGGSFSSNSGGPRFVALEYNGGGHLTRDRQAEDERRTNEILAYGGIEYQLKKGSLRRFALHGRPCGGDIQRYWSEHISNKRKEEREASRAEARAQGGARSNRRRRVGRSRQGGLSEGCAQQARRAWRRPR